MSNKVAFLTLGCKLNYAETSTYERAFVEAGCEVVPWSRQADIYIINTCSVTATSDSKSRNLIRKVHRINPDAKIIVTGCSAELRREEIEEIEGITRVFGAKEKHLVVSETLGLPAHKTETFAAFSSGERTRSFLKVQDGCDNLCLYCTVPYARGNSRNIPIEECVREAGMIASKGIIEVVLTGVNTGDFGRSTGESFLQLLKSLNEVKGIERYRISSIEPNLITEEIIDWIATGTKFQPHFHIPLQAGCNELLSAMGRKYTTEFFADRIAYIRRKLEAPGKPKVFFGIDVMVGLPGETPEMFQRTYDFLANVVKPAFIHVFPYSRRPGTPAADMPDQVPEQIKKERLASLEALCAKLHKEFVEANAGIRETVLFESKEKGGTMSGYTGNYIRITRPFDASLVGKLTQVIIQTL